MESGVSKSKHFKPSQKLSLLSNELLFLNFPIITSKVNSFVKKNISRLLKAFKIVKLELLHFTHLSVNQS